MSQVGAEGAFPELDREREHLAFVRECRDHMIDRLERVDPSASADEITAEYVEMTVAEALDSLRSPGAGEFFGRIDEPAPNRTSIEHWYIGRRHVENDTHDPVVVDWRAPISAPFYRATAIDPLGVVFRRRFTFDEGLMTAYLDEHLDDPDAVDVAAGIPDPVLAEIGAARSGAMREIVATIQAEQDIVIRAPIDQALIVQGGPGTGKTAVALHRAAYLLFEHRHRLARDGVLVVGPNRAFLDYIANVLPSLGERSVRQCTAIDLCIPKTEITAVDDVEDGALERFRRSSRRARATRARRDPSADRRRARADRCPHSRVLGGVDRRMDRRRQVGRGPDQPAARTVAGARPPGVAPALWRRRLLVVGRPAQDGDQRLLADSAAGQARRPHAARTIRPA